MRADGPVNTPREDQLTATPGHEHAASTACDCGRPQRRKAVAVELKEVQGARGVADGGVPSLGAISDELVGSARWVPGVRGVAPSQRVAAREGVLGLVHEAAEPPAARRLPQPEEREL